MNNKADEQYLNLLKDILENGNLKEDRTGTGTKSVFGRQMRFNLQDGFPLLTSKKTHFKSIVHELLWMISGDTNIKYLVDHDVNIWNEWPYKNYCDSYDKAYNEYVEKNKNTELYSSDLSMLSLDIDANISATSICNLTINNKENINIGKYSLKEFVEQIKNDKSFADKFGNLGPVYGHQWRNFNSENIDQLKEAIDTLKNNPDSRRIIVNAWNPAQLKEMALPPCHSFYQFYSEPLSKLERWSLYTKQCFKLGITVRPLEDPTITDSFLTNNNIPTRKLSLQLYQRSVDCGLGLPFNIAFYSLLLTMIAQITDHHINEFIWNGGDTHIYKNHFKGIEELISREVIYDLPKIKLSSNVKEINDFKFEDIKLIGYKSYPTIKLPVAV